MSIPPSIPTSIAPPIQNPEPWIVLRNKYDVKVKVDDDHVKVLLPPWNIMLDFEQDELYFLCVELMAFCGREEAGAKKREEVVKMQEAMMISRGIRSPVSSEYARGVRDGFDTGTTQVFDWFLKPESLESKRRNE